jgi:hypothetical protein
MDATLFTAFFVCVCVCMRTRLLSGARFEYIVNPRCKCLFISLHRLAFHYRAARQTRSQPAAFVTSSVNSEQERGCALFQTGRPPFLFSLFSLPQIAFWPSLSHSRFRSIANEPSQAKEREKVCIAKYYIKEESGGECVRAAFGSSARLY